MPIIPWDVRDPVTGEFPEFLPAARELNELLPIVCPVYGNLETWQRNAFADLAPGGGGSIARLVTGRNLWDAVCEPFGGIGALPPASAQAPTFGENCDTQGSIRSQINVGASAASPVWVVSETFWACGDNVGIPVGQPEWRFISGSQWGYFQTFLTADGLGTTERSGGVTTFGDERDRVVIEAFNISYCPSCSLPDPPPPPPTIPDRGTRPPRPVINLPITIPQPTGLPPISFEIPYSPTVNINLDASLQPTLTLEPNLEINPSLAFAPSFEFNFGGVSIGGGGYPEPREDVSELADCDCPDPCPPPGDDVDYQRIQNAFANVLASRLRLPGFDRDPVLGGFTSFSEAIAIDLDADTIAVQVQVDATNYTGGGSPTVNGVQGNGYYGWYAFQGAIALGTGGERRFLSSQGAFIEIPPYSARFAVYCQNGATCRVRQVRLGEIPPA